MPVDTPDGNQPERRYKLLSIRPMQMLSLFYPICEMNIYSKINLPDDVHIKDVEYRPERQAFEFLLESPTFEPVAQGDYIPEIDPMFYAVSKYQIVEIEKESK